MDCPRLEGEQTSTIAVRKNNQRNAYMSFVFSRAAMRFLQESNDFIRGPFFTPSLALITPPPA
jgi:hypothetical protein